MAPADSTAAAAAAAAAARPAGEIMETTERDEAMVGGRLKERAEVIKMRPDLIPIRRVSDAALCSHEPGEFQVSMGEYG